LDASPAPPEEALSTMTAPTVLKGKQHLKIAIIYDETTRPDTIGEYCRRALERQGRIVTHFLPDEVADIPPIYDLYLRVGEGREYDLPEALRPMATWALGTDRGFLGQRGRIPGVDWTFCAQRDDAARMRAEGIPNAFWLPLACNPETHRRIPFVGKEYDICFVGRTGTGDGERTRWVEWIRRHVPRAFVGEAHGDELSRVYSASRLVFNCAVGNDINRRVFEAAACGSLLITNDLAENGQDLLFTPGVHLLTYQRGEDLPALIQQFLHDENERERIAQTGMEHVRAHHTYAHRMDDILSAVCGGARLDDKYPVEGVERTTVGRGQNATAASVSGDDRAGGSDGIRRASGEPPATPAPVAARNAGGPVPWAEGGGHRFASEMGRAMGVQVSIVIPTHNRLDLTRQCVASIRQHTETPHEIIIVDNGSTDGTPAWAREEGLRVISHTQNHGVPAACNRGILASLGEYVLLLHNDTLVPPGWAARLLAHARTDPSVGLVGPTTNFATSSQQVAVFYETHEAYLACAAERSHAHREPALEVERLAGFCLLVPRSVVQMVGLFDERFGLGKLEDDDYCLRVRMAGYRLLWAQDVLVHHEGHQTFGQLGDAFGEVLERNKRLFLEKWDIGRHLQSVASQAPAPAAVPRDPWEMLAAERYGDAYELFEAEVRANPANTHALFGLGLAAEGRGVPAAARVAYRTVLAMAPGDPDAMRGLARVGGVDPAGEGGRRMHRSDPPAEDLAGISDGNGVETVRVQPAALQQHAGRMLPIRSEESGGLAMGQGALERKAWAEACHGFIRALEEDSTCAAARSGLGLALMALGDAEEGLAQLQESVRLSPTPDAVCNLACGWIDVGRHAEARQLLEGILTVVPTHEAARANRDALLRVAERSRLPVSYFQSPHPRIIAMLNASADHLAHRRWAEAITGFRMVLRHAPDLVEVRAALGSALTGIGETEHAVSELRAVVDVLDTSRAWNDLGCAYAVDGQMEDSRVALVTAIERDPTNLEPQRNLAALFEGLGMPQEASAAYELMLLTAPGNAEATMGKMRCAEKASPSRTAMDVARELAVTHG
jgi:GT2 family glycosyltransferase/Flp pilus assembly protein TadD